MSWLDLHRRHALPEGATPGMAAALDRRMRGERLDARRAENRLLGLLDQERAGRNHIDWGLRDELLRNEDGHATAGSPSRGKAGSGVTAPPTAARPGAVPLSTAPRSPAQGLSALGGPGAFGRTTSLDARFLSDEEYRQYLAARGLDSSWYESRNSPKPAQPGLAVRLKMDRMQREAQQRNEKRSAELQAGALDARVADPAAVRERLAALGIEHDIASSIREPGKPLDPLKEPPPPARAADAAAKRVRYMMRTGQKIDARKLSPEQHAALLRARGFDAPTSWGPAGRAPPRR